MEVLIQAIYILENHFIKNTITLKHHTDQMLKTQCGKITFLTVNNCLLKCPVIQLPLHSGQVQTAFWSKLEGMTLATKAIIFINITTLQYSLSHNPLPT